jgi:sialic acid synthase SpsE
MWGTDHQSSIEVHAMVLLRNRLRGINGLMGKSNKIITESEKEALKKLRG